METSELLKKVRKIEIKTRGLSKQVFSGEYHSAFKGRGMAFSEVRNYMPGDEIRTIDWNVTARFNDPYVKVFEEERELAKSLVKEENYFLVHVNCSVEKCEERDVKVLYKKARAGEIKNFTGIDSPYEIPNKPNLIVDTEKESVSESVDKIFSAISNKIK